MRLFQDDNASNSNNNKKTNKGPMTKDPYACDFAEILIIADQINISVDKTVDLYTCIKIFLELTPNLRYKMFWHCFWDRNCAGIPWMREEVIA